VLLRQKKLIVAGIPCVKLIILSEQEHSAGLPPEKKIEKNNINNMQNIGAKVLSSIFF